MIKYFLLPFLQLSIFAATTAFPISVGFDTNRNMGPSGLKNTNFATIYSTNLNGGVTPSGASLTRNLDLRLIDAYNLKDFATGGGVVDDTTAIATAVNLAQSNNKGLYVPAGTYINTNTVRITNSIKIFGDGSKSLFMSHGSASTFNISSNVANVIFESLAFDSTNTGTNINQCIDSTSDNITNVFVLNCHFGQTRLNLLDANVFDNTPKNTNVVIRGNEFHGDYTGAIAFQSIQNVIQLGGWIGITIVDNQFFVTNPERVIHFPGGNQTLTITDNKITSMSLIGDQCSSIEGNKKVIFSRNHFNLTGNWVCYIEGKNGVGGPFYSEPNDIQITENDFVGASTYTNFSGISLLGMWGLGGSQVSNSIATLARNHFQMTATNSVDPIISAKGFNSVSVAGNIIDSGDDRDYQRAINVDCNEYHSVIGNIIRAGSITVSGTAFNNFGIPYTNQPKKSVITGNIVQSFKQLGGIYGVGLTNTILDWTGNSINTQWGSNNAVALYYTATNCVGVTGNVTGNGGTKADLTISYTSLNGFTGNQGGNAWQTYGGTVNTLPKWNTDTNSLVDSPFTAQGNLMGLGTGTYISKVNLFGGDFAFGDTGANSRFITLYYQGTNAGSISTTGGIMAIGGPALSNSPPIQIDGQQNIFFNYPLANKVLGLNASKQLTNSTTTVTELNFLSGITSSITNQLGGAVTNGNNLGTGWPIYAGKTNQVTQFNSITNGAGISSSSNANTITLTANYNNFTNFTTIAVSDTTSTITAGVAKQYWRAPKAFTLLSTRASVSTVSSSGLVTVNIKKNGTTIYSTKLTIDASELTSVTAATPAVLSTTAFADDDLLTFDIDTAGTGAVGLQVKLYYTIP